MQSIPEGSWYFGHHHPTAPVVSTQPEKEADKIEPVSQSTQTIFNDDEPSDEGSAFGALGLIA